LAEVRRAAETLLANTVIETFNVRVEATPESDEEDTDGESPDEDDEAEPADEGELATQAG
jgi:hypothetical protein